MTTIDELVAGLDDERRETATRLCTLLDSALPEASARVYHGHPVWLDEARPVAGFKPFPRYVTFMIWNAEPIDDTSGTLVPGARMSTVKYAAAEEIDEALVRDWLARSAGVRGA
ncbi:Domain of unknown function DUF1801 [Beutenbergia cavernae DSM 12333]|uniref:YdhG-like domain-containing protein n=1 Tax=Beutenbergia cavernae (strain ATCC BAA-8 / DSM 12333 / CCUG 43141 / JCM 11478 / NBRC 16432 / NCIMB 13614 / HKI 0122) TaxID=471853 RepID=C5BX35_BEUC1|nr:DUF1801 domain-containing protein [Beutenbergia cavernae]ACQ78710.1 Domain of unknown function DUF1801 [Beutenbergia cavernae DSM 12333]